MVLSVSFPALPGDMPGRGRCHQIHTVELRAVITGANQRSEVAKFDAMK